MALTDATGDRRRRDRLVVDDRVSLSRGDGYRDRKPIRTLIMVLVIVAMALVVALVGFLILSSTPAFTIASIDTEATEHLSAENIAKLANVGEGTTLLTLDERAITENLKRNPWVGEVSYTRKFPDRLGIEVTERTVDCLVKMSTGSVCWCLGDDGVWIEPINLTVRDGQSADDVSLALAQDMGSILITDVPTSMSPSAGAVAADEVLKAVNAYRDQFSPDLTSQIVCFSASSIEGISCTLTSGVEVSLGAPTDIKLKEEVILQIIEKHPSQITFINVRVPSQPSYRKLGVETVSQGTGVTVDIDAADAVSGETTAIGQGMESSEGTTAEGGEGAAEGMPQEGADAYVEDEWYGSGDGSTEDLILGDDGNYYTYEQYWGLE